MRLKPWTAIAAALCTLAAAPAAHAAYGDLDPAFGTGGIAEIGSDSETTRIALQPDGGVVVAGHNVGGDVSMHVHRLTPSGQLDTAFGGDGVATLDSGGAARVAVQPDGKIVVVGTRSPDFAGDATVFRLTAGGDPDPSFGGDGEVSFDFVPGGSSGLSALALQQDGRIVVAGYAGGEGPGVVGLARLLPDGSLDSSFGGDGLVVDDLGADLASVTSVARQGERMVIAGQVRPVGAGPYDRRLFVARRTVSGGRDASFGSGGIVLPDLADPSGATDALVTPDGGVVAVGYETTVPAPDPTEAPGETRVIALRLHGDGAADEAFGPDGVRPLELDGFPSVAATADGGYAVSGSVGEGEGRRFAIATLTAGGSLDSGFGSGGMRAYGDQPGTAFDLTTQPDGKLLAGLSAAGLYQMSVVRIQGPAPPAGPAQPGPPRLSVAGGSAFEGDLVPFTLTLDRAADVPVTVDYVTGDGTAVRRLDYVGSHGTATIPAGQTTVTLRFASILDRLFETDEQFRVELFNAVNARLDQHIDRATIRNTLRSGRCANIVVGGGRDDTLSGSVAGDGLDGRTGHDVLFGLAGDDCITGDRGDDKVFAGPGDDVVHGGVGNDELKGDEGDDRLIGGRGYNRYSGGDGSDRIYARNGRSEIVECGPGRDWAKVDRSDRLRRCERVFRGGR